MRENHDRPVTVNLTQRQYDALAAYAAQQGLKPATYVRILVTDDVPRELYRPLEPPPGQLSLTDG